ncbi:MAG TPA: DUF3016 domain-containing protein [Opitutaceae bacterium]|nr:DUF3016 domain-containing protein [Opitutaceae bacterium]
MNTRRLVLVMLLGVAGAGSVFAVGPSAAPPVSRVSVVFVEPQKFTDVKIDSRGGNSADLLDQLQRFMRAMGEACVPPGLRLEVRVTDIHLAGNIEPGRGARFGDVRIVRSIYPPCIKLEFQVTDGKGALLKEGKREITDPAFQMRDPWPEDDYLRYEKDMLRDWFRTEFRSLRKT